MCIRNKKLENSRNFRYGFPGDFFRRRQKTVVGGGGVDHINPKNISATISEVPSYNSSMTKGIKIKV